MPQPPSPERVAQRLLAEVASSPELTDELLLTRYQRDNDPVAFRVLYDRYAGLVYRVCRRGLGEADAEAAFQAVWLVFARKAGTVRRPAALAGWLTRVGLRVVAKARQRAANRPTPRSDLVDAAADPTPGTDPARRAELRDLAAAVTRAVADLPDREREAFELCYLEGLGRSGAIEKLGLTELQFDRRIRRAKDRLQRALAKTGLTLPVTLTAAAVGAGGAAPAGLLAEMAAKAFDGRLVPLTRVALPPPAVSLARAVLSGGWVRPLVWAAVATAVITAGAVVVAESPAPPPRPPDDGRTTQPAAVAEREPLRVKNERIMRDELVPRLRAALQEMAPADNPVRLVAVRSRGSEVEAEFRYDKKLVYEPREGGYRLRYCVFRRMALTDTNLTEDGDWHPTPIYPADSLSMTELDLPFGLGRVAISIGREQLARVKAILGELPSDDRAEQAHLEQMFGWPTGELTLPVLANIRGVCGNEHDLFLTTEQGSLYLRRADGRWNYLGQCPNGSALTADEQNLYCTDWTFVYTRPIDESKQPWRSAFLLPTRLQGSRGRLVNLGVGAGRMRASYEIPGAIETWERSLSDPAAEWRIVGPPQSVHSPLVVNDHQYALFDDRLASRPLGNDTAAWQMETTRPAKNVCLFFRVGGTVYIGGTSGPIYSRPLKAGPDVGWQVAGRVRTPAQEGVVGPPP